MDWREEKLYGKGMPKGIMRGKIMCRISIVGSLVQVQNVDRFYVNWSRIVGRSSLAIMFCYCFKVNSYGLDGCLKSYFSVQNVI